MNIEKKKKSPAYMKVFKSATNTWTSFLNLSNLSEIP